MPAPASLWARLLTALGRRLIDRRERVCPRFQLRREIERLDSRARRAADEELRLSLRHRLDGRGDVVVELPEAIRLTAAPAKLPARGDERFEPQALLATDPTLPPVALVQYFVRRWQVEVTFEEARRHLGLETQRQWSDRAIARTTPVLLSLFSLVTVCATRLAQANALPVQRTAWYPKGLPTFSDALAAVRRECWRQMDFSTSFHLRDPRKLPNAIYRAVIEPLLYAT